MVDEYQQQYYEAEPPPSMPWKTIAIVVGAVIIGVAIIIGAVMLVRSWQRDSQLAQMEERVVETVEDQLAASLDECEDMEDPEGCRTRLLTQAATERNAVAVCETLEGSALASCVELIADEQEDPELCETIEEKDLQDDCQDGVLLGLIVSDKDYDRCDELVDLEMQELCREQIAPYLWSINQCADHGLDQQLCDDAQKSQQAIATGDIDLCSGLSPDIAADCLDNVTLRQVDVEADLDSDLDGLLDSEEVLYGTDPANPDTDGDGYDDGTEVAGGYNPLGEGGL